MRRSPLVVLALVVVMLLTPGVALASPAAEYATTAVKATNKAREAHDRGDLKVDACLRGFAVKQARAMVRAGEMYHQDGAGKGRHRGFDVSGRESVGTGAGKLLMRAEGRSRLP